MEGRKKKHQISTGSTMKKKEDTMALGGWATAHACKFVDFTWKSLESTNPIKWHFIFRANLTWLHLEWICFFDVYITLNHFWVHTMT
jgi:hypothetical protein